jgi:hypothetical protein
MILATAESVLIAIAFLSTILTGCNSGNTKEVASEEETSTVIEATTDTESEAVDTESIIESNSELLYNTLTEFDTKTKSSDTDEHTLYESYIHLTSDRLVNVVGCTQIVEIKDLERDKCYTMTIIDDTCSEYFITISLDGYIGYVQDSTGDTVYYELDD